VIDLLKSDRRRIPVPILHLAIPVVRLPRCRPTGCVPGTDLLENTSHAGIAMELLTSSGVVVSLETYSQSCLALSLNMKHKRTNRQG
jgi:hypothetical protein